MASETSFSAFKSWPSAPLTDSLVQKSISSLQRKPTLVNAPIIKARDDQLLQWSTYDEIDHELTLASPDAVLSSSYVIRKALTRKHFLSRSILSYVTKNPQSALSAAAPQTFELEISFADELEEMLTDELWELGRDLDSDTPRWWILKPGMADRGNGIRLFNSRSGLEHIFEEFEESDEEDAEDSGEQEPEEGTAVITSQLRHFVIQEYLSYPLLIDPREVSVQGSAVPSVLEGRKFHLRAYCVASGALEVYLYERILALFSATPYASPTTPKEGDETPIDLSPHLTNTSLQKEHGEQNVRLLDELVGCHICSDAPGNDLRLTADDVKNIIEQISAVLAESFQAALQNPIHFQVLPNAFELFGVDFLVTYNPSSSPTIQVHLLEFNSEPAIELTGPRLTWILEDLFVAMGKVCVEPFFRPPFTKDVEGWRIGKWVDKMSRGECPLSVEVLSACLRT
ncbi:tubulin-tyrosine ligase [Hymenopellis radicata]|nr:tubulin-tyrosine ligase [Hymenopellis radicata]